MSLIIIIILVIVIVKLVVERSIKLTSERTSFSHGFVTFETSEQAEAAIDEVFLIVCIMLFFTNIAKHFKVVRNSFPFSIPTELYEKGLLVFSKRLLLLVDSQCCNNLSTYQLLYCH